MNQTFKKFSICSIALLGLLGVGTQVTSNSSKIHTPISVSASTNNVNNTHKGLSKTAHRIKRDVLHQEKIAIQDNQPHIQMNMPQNLTPKQQQYYKNLVQRNDIFLQVIRQFAIRRENYHYPEIASNTRDLGGYHTENGLIVKPHKLIRSNNLHNLTPQGDNYLKDTLHVNDVIDLRNSSQINKSPDADENSYNLYNDSVYNQRNAKKTNHDMYKYGSQYRYQNLYSTDKQARNAYRKALHQILNDKDGTVLYHCIEGRDRTGITTILLLSSLHVPKSTIVKDYLLTTYYEPNALFTDQAHNLNTFYRTINNRYGNINGYLDSLGIKTPQRNELQSRYLESNQVKPIHKQSQSHVMTSQQLKEIMMEIKYRDEQATQRNMNGASRRTLFITHQHPTIKEATIRHKVNVHNHKIIKEIGHKNIVHKAHKGKKKLIRIKHHRARRHGKKRYTRTQQYNSGESLGAIIRRIFG